MKKNAGQSFPLNLDDEILQINSPQNSVDGPWFVVYKDLTERWAVVIMRWENEPCLGIRWFHRGCGTPSVRGFATWFVIPKILTDSILNKLPILPSLRKKIDEILQGNYRVEKLQEFKNNNQ